MSKKANHTSDPISSPEIAIDDLEDESHERKSIGYKIRSSVLLLISFLLASIYITGHLVFSDAAFKASDTTSYLVPYVTRADQTAGDSSDGEPSVEAATNTYCGNPFFGFDGIFWKAGGSPILH